MMPGRAALLAFAIVLGCASESWAQFSPAAECQKFVPIRDAVQKSGAAIQAAGKRKASAAVVCKLFRRFATHSAKMLKFMKDNKQLCGVPDQAIKGAETNLSQAVRIRGQVCKVAAGPPRPPPPSLSDALGAPVVATPDNTKTKSGGSTFDTLTGNVLAR